MVSTPSSIDRAMRSSSTKMAIFLSAVESTTKSRSAAFEVELGEIEAVLDAQDHVRQAVVVLRNEDGIDELVAFITTTGAAINLSELRANLRKRLPAYMAPSRFEILNSLPKLPSGKADRKALKRLTLMQSATTGEEQEEPANEIEATLLNAARRVLPPGAIPLDADFFTDLGGHSLLAARFVSIVRETPPLASITLQDVYTQRSLRSLASHLLNNTKEAPHDLSFEPPPLQRRFLCGLAQAIALPFISLSLPRNGWKCSFLTC